MKNKYLKAIDIPISYEMRYYKYLNDILTRSLREFKKNYNNIDVINKSNVLKEFEDATASIKFSERWVKEYFKQLKKYHDKHFNYAMKKTMDIANIISKLSDDQINKLIDSIIKDNVSLIKTINTRLHDQVKDVIQNNFKEAGEVDRGKLLNQITTRFNVSKSNAKRIAGDQTSKAIGSLTRVRHGQVGIKKYRWMGKEDRRERRSHDDNNNQIFSYNNPPPDTGNPSDDVNCRCVAIGILAPKMQKQLKNTQGTLIKYN